MKYTNRYVAWAVIQYLKKMARQLLIPYHEKPINNL